MTIEEYIECVRKIIELTHHDDYIKLIYIPEDMNINRIDYTTLNIHNIPFTKLPVDFYPNYNPKECMFHIARRYFGIATENIEILNYLSVIPTLINRNLEGYYNSREKCILMNVYSESDNELMYLFIKYTLEHLIDLGYIIPEH